MGSNINKKKIIEYLFYLFIFLLPLQTRWIWRYGQLGDPKWARMVEKFGWRWEFGTMSLYGTEILLWLIFLLVLLQLIIFNFLRRGGFNQFSIIQFLKSKSENLKLKIKNLFKIQNSKFKIPLTTIFIILPLYTFISIFWSLDKPLAAYYFFHLAEGAVLIFLIGKINFDYKKIFYTIFASSFIQACLGIWQFISQHILANKWLGIAEQKPMDLAVSVVFDGERRWLRAYGGFFHPNVLAGFLAIGFLIGLYLIINQVVENKKQLYGKLILILANLIILIGLLFTFSRGAWASLSVVLLLYCYIIIIKISNFQFPISKQITNSKFQIRNLILFLAYCLLLIVAIVLIFKEPFLTRIKGVETLEKKSTEERIGYYRQAWQIIKKRPIFGVGIGNYTVAVHDLLDPNQKPWDYQPAHNIFVLVLAELGMVGFLLLLFLFYKLIKESILCGGKNQKSSNINLIIHYSLFIILLLGLFDHYWWTSYWGIIFLCLMIGLTIKLNKNAA